MLLCIIIPRVVPTQLFYFKRKYQTCLIDNSVKGQASLIFMIPRQPDASPTLSEEEEQTEVCHQPVFSLFLV